ncbi:MAG: ABC transporter substrate-binding protein [Acidimicrobiales bacterium]|jgi:peptide/nickel transport system substrate-binding protein
MTKLFHKRPVIALGMATAALFAGFTAVPQASSAASAGSSSHYGGVLYMLGSGDVDYFDPNISYYTVGYLGLRIWTEDLLGYPAIPGQTIEVAPELATAMPAVSDGGTLYTLTIRKGAEWNTSPPRQVTAADAQRGIERTCNPAEPFGGLSDFEGLIVGMTSFCSAFEKVKPTVPAIKQFLATHSISGVIVNPANPLQLSFKLVHPETYFANLLALPAFTPAPIEDLNYLPASAALAQHTVADGPYEVQSYVPARSITFVRNPVWKASLDPISKAYVDEIKVIQTDNATTVQQELQTNSPTADLAWGDTEIPPAQLPALLASHNPGVVLGLTQGQDPFLVFNQKDPNDNKVMQDLNVRRAISYALDRSALVTDAGGPVVSPPLTQLLPPGVPGSSNFDLYPYNPAKAKALLDGKSYTFKFLYQIDNPVQVKIFQTIQYELSSVGITLQGEGVPSADIYVKYFETPSTGERGVWDLGLSQWYPDWYGNNAAAFLIDQYQTSAFPPLGDNFGFEGNPAVNSLIARALVASSTSAANSLWAQADHQIMEDAAVYMINSPQFATYHPTQVQNDVFVPSIQAIDPTNVWLSPNDRQNI